MAKVSDDKRPIHAYLSVTAHAALQDWADDHGVSFSGFIEALGQAVVEYQQATNGKTRSKVAHPLDAWVEPTRRVDVERRKRQRRGPNAS